MNLLRENPISKVRTKCVICNQNYLKKFIEINKFPIYMGCTDSAIQEDIYCDQEWVICENCGCVQLVRLLDPSILYSSGHQSGAIGETWISHHQEFANFIQKWSPKSICEIGAAHGFLAKLILDVTPSTKYLIIEPDPSQRDSRVEYVKDFFETNPKIIANYDHVVHSHVLEHVYEPLKFLENIRDHMRPDSLMHLSVPNIERLIETKGTNSLNFEHTYYLHIDQLEIVLKNLGFKIIDSQHFMKHSYFLTVRKTPVTESRHFPNIALQGLLFKEMLNEISIFSSKIDDVLKNSSHNVFLFGAHVFSQSIYHELKSDKKQSLNLIDNAQEKQGKRLYGTKMTVYSPEFLRNKNNATVILRASHYQEEIRNQILKINPLINILE